jgi:hypothetical protein
LAVDDEPSLSYVPYFGDGDHEDIYTELFDTTERERLYEFGPTYAEEETLGTIDDVLRYMMTNMGGYVSFLEDATTLDRIHLVLSELADVDLVRVQERHALCFAGEWEGGENSENSHSSSDSPCSPSRKNGKKADDVRDRPSIGKDGIYGSAYPCGSNRSRMSSDSPVAVEYENFVDSYRNLFCRRCFTYDCNVHGNLPKANLDLLAELAAQKESDGHWKEVSVGSTTHARPHSTLCMCVRVHELRLVNHPFVRCIVS